MSDDSLFDPPDAQGLENLKLAIAHRLSDSFMRLGRPGRSDVRTVAQTIEMGFASNAASSIIPSLSDSMVESLTNSAVMETS